MKISRTQLIAIALKRLFELDNQSLAEAASVLMGETINQDRSLEQEDMFEAPLELAETFINEPSSVPLNEALAVTQLITDLKSNLERARTRIDTGESEFNFHQVKVLGSDSNLYSILVLIDWLENTQFTEYDMVFNGNPTWIGEIKCHQFLQALNVMMIDGPSYFDLAEALVMEKLQKLSETKKVYLLNALKGMDYQGDEPLMIYELLEKEYPLHMAWLTVARNQNQGPLIKPITLVHQWYLDFENGTSVDPADIERVKQAGYTVHSSEEAGVPSYAFCIEGDYSQELPTELAAWAAAVNDLNTSAVS